ncbi:AMP-binding protein [Streptococcus mutans]|jgi:Acyl-CoA synthetases (AMP-forming)/AMP-acid ligases II|uniref:AMP-binding protein n=1 Tax=Streptococcus mutans TaxID=1309 RepID=UPI0002B5983C|nr:AMP-binding protein [Streptococcus mutans]EMC03001.1 putative peptide synthetase [Streptococcus mutans NFSM1]MCB4949357.1 AMP-binding protein [Streptococcus mutans]MCB4960588.1 AMP-binding protein [Streptococcus mutans]MCB5001643.1 AMP-binding protein [Streptococcus mutans]MCB5078292.1 AMP-binding protein [Streptococcus mutans]
MAKFIDVLKKNISENRGKKLYTYYEGYDIKDSVTYSEFDSRVKDFGGYLQSLDSKGERALILLPSGVDYLVAYFACLFTQTICIPMYAVDDQSKAEIVKQIIENSDAQYIITSTKYRTSLEYWFGDLVEDLMICYIDDFVKSNFVEEEIYDEQIAYLQYTSGSTSQAKGVKVTYNNIYANCLIMKNHLGFNDKDIFTTWLPFYFDMGLIGSAINTIFNASSNYFTSAEGFVKSPISWLNAISIYHGTILIAPNFAYEMCSKIDAEKMKDIDLSSVRLTINGSEPVRHSTLHALAEKMKKYKLNPQTFNPAYGLAENTLIVSAHHPEKSYQHVTIDGEKLRNNTIEFCDEGLDIVSCGTICAGVEVKIVGLEDNNLLAEDEIGEIWISGQSVTQGYWNLDEESGFNNFLPNEDQAYFTTGDLGFLHNGFLYVVGRKKDMVIIRGKNFYSQDIEEIILKNTDNKLKNAIAFAIDINNTEELTIMAELSDNATDVHEELVTMIKNIVATNCKIVPYDIVLYQEEALPRTGSGKIQRQSCKKLYLG